MANKPDRLEIKFLLNADVELNNIFNKCPHLGKDDNQISQRLVDSVFFLANGDPCKKRQQMSLLIISPFLWNWPRKCNGKEQARMGKKSIRTERKLRHIFVLFQIAKYNLSTPTVNECKPRTKGSAAQKRTKKGTWKALQHSEICAGHCGPGGMQMPEGSNTYFGSLYRQCTSKDMPSYRYQASCAREFHRKWYELKQCPQEPRRQPQKIPVCQVRHL